MRSNRQKPTTARAATVVYLYSPEKSENPDRLQTGEILDDEHFMTPEDENRTKLRIADSSHRPLPHN